MRHFLSTLATSFVAFWILCVQTLPYAAVPLLVAATIATLASCNNSDENSVIENNAEKFNIVVENNVVISPKWVEDIRVSIAKGQDDSFDSRHYTWVIWVYSCKYEGKEYIYFENQASSWIDSTMELYDVTGKKRVVSRANLVLDDVRRVCPVIED